MVALEDGYPGMRVVACMDHPGGNPEIPVGLGGTICYVKNNAFFGVVWDKNVHGHSCGGCCETGFGWEVYPGAIAPEELPDFESSSGDPAVLL